MISPPPPPRLTPRAWAAVHRFAAAWVEGGHGVRPALQVEVSAEDVRGAPALRLQLVDSEAGIPAPPGGTSEARGDRIRDRPVPLRYEAATALTLRGQIIDFEDAGGEGGVRGFLVRTAGPSGSRAPSPPSPAAPSEAVQAAPPAAPSPPPASPRLVQLAPRRPRPSPVGGGTGPEGGMPAPSATPDPERAEVPGGRLEGEPLAQAIRRALEDRVNPLVESHGGRVQLEGVDGEGVARVSMAGGCQGCASAAGTLNQVVRRILLRAVPSITDVVDVTVHAEGENPWFRAAGRSTVSSCSDGAKPAPAPALS